MGSIKTARLRLAALALLLATGSVAAANPSAMSGDGVGAGGRPDLPGVAACSLFGAFYDGAGGRLRDTAGLSWEAQVCAAAEYGAQRRTARPDGRPERRAQAAGLSCANVAQFYDERGVILPGLQLLPWETQPCAAIQRSRYLAEATSSAE